MAASEKNYEEQIAALEARVTSMEEEKSAFLQKLQAMEERLTALENAGAKDIEGSLDFSNANHTETTSVSEETINTDTTVSSDSDTATDNMSETTASQENSAVSVPASVTSQTSESSSASVSGQALGSEPASAAEETAPSTESLEDKYASDSDAGFDPGTLDPDLLKFFETISSETAKNAAGAKTPEPSAADSVPSAGSANSEPSADFSAKAPVNKPETTAPKPAVKKQILHRPGFHLYNWFYYSNPKDHGNLYRMKEDESQNERLTDYPVDMTNFKFKDHHLYFKNKNWSERTIRLSNEALDAYDLETEVDMLNAKLHGFKHNGWIYYANPYMGYFLYRVKEDGTCNQRLTEYSLPKSQTFRVINNDLNFYDDFLTPHKLPVRP